MAEPTSKKPRTHPSYELLYHPGIPGRGEFVRLAFEAAGVAYTDVANATEDGYSTVQKICMQSPTEAHDDAANPPVFAPPALRVPGAGKNGAALLIHQTPTILLYLGGRLGLAPGGSDDDDEAGRMYVHQLAQTALDLNDEMHDTHHPIASMEYYEDQQAEARRKAADVRAHRIPKYLAYFERALAWNAGEGKGRYLVGDRLTYADLTLWQVLDGMRFAFPKELAARAEEFPRVLRAFYDSVREEKGVRDYLQSERRLPYSHGIYRYYPELDRE